MPIPTRYTVNLRTYLLITMLAFLSVVSQITYAAPTNKPLIFWVDNDENNTHKINHGLWQALLDSYLTSNHPSGVNRFNYAMVTSGDRKKLNDYLNNLQQLDPRTYNRAEQQAYWINLYNALTVELILKNYPVESITKLGESYFSFGPWDDNVATIQGKKLSLNNIEQGILRALFKDNRIHYAVNCASISCPNLAAQAFTAENTNQLLDQGAKQYVNHPRGVVFKDDTLKVSSIYHWYKVDFGNNDEALIHHLIKYAEPELADKLQHYQGNIEHHYNWYLNKPLQHNKTG